MKWNWYLLGGGGVLVLFAIVALDLGKQWNLLKGYEPYTTELKQMSNTFAEWKGDVSKGRRFVELVKESRRLPPLPPNDNPDVVRLQTAQPLHCPTDAYGP